MDSSSQLAPPGKRSRECRIVLAAIAIVVLGYLVAVGSSVTSIVSEEPSGYYGLLTDALTSGQLHLKLEPDPGLARLANPWAGAQGVPRVHDATYFNGHYYLYFGVTPVIVFYAPWHVLFGNYINEAVGTFIFGLVGFLLCTRLWLRLKQSWFPQLSPGWTALAVLLFGLGNYQYFLLESPVFYHVPIACAYMCLMGALCALESGLEASFNKKTQAAHLALASLLWALCVGARPNYVFSLPLLGMIGLSLALREGGIRQLRQWPAWRLLISALVPAAIVGAGLAWYNYARFGNVTEFGVKYQFASIDQRFLKLMDPANLSSTLHSYLRAGANYTPYYPFIEEKLDVIGVLVWAPFAILTLFFPIVLFRADRKENPTWTILGATIFAIALMHLLSLGLIPFANDRYVGDFLPESMLLAMAVSAAWIVSTERIPWLSALGKIVILYLAGDTLVHSNLLALQRNSSPRIQKLLAIAGDSLAPTWERLFKVKMGRVDLALTFNEINPGIREPIVSTSEGRDLVYIIAEDTHHIRFGFFHFGSGGPTGESIPIELGKTYHVSVDLGSLYPPAEHPAFRGWDEPMIDALHRRVEVRFEGMKVLRWTSSFYDSNPFIVQIGRNTKTKITTRRFSGKIVSVLRSGLPSPAQIPDVPGDGAVRLTVKFPPFSNIISQPLISTGRPGAGDLVYVTYLSPTKLRFGHDSWGAGAVETTETEYDPNQTHTIEIDMGSLHAGALGLLESKTRLKVRFDDFFLISTRRPFHPSSPLDVSLGYDTTRSSAASPFFTGSELTAERIPDVLDPPPPEMGWGPVRLVVQLKNARKNSRDPLLVTGSTGAADFIYIIYDDGRHIRVGLDHWGTGGVISNPVEVNLSKPIVITISTPALYPPAVAKEWAEVSTSRQQELRTSSIVLVNNQEVIHASIIAYPAAVSEIYIGNNPVGGSSCDYQFSGSIQSSARMKVGGELESK